VIDLDEFKKEDWYVEQRKEWDVLVSDGWVFSVPSTVTPSGSLFGDVALMMQRGFDIAIIQSRNGMSPRNTHTRLLLMAKAIAQSVRELQA
jgi:hypothetical protein